MRGADLLVWGGLVGAFVAAVYLTDPGEQAAPAPVAPRTGLTPLPIAPRPTSPVTGPATGDEAFSGVPLEEGELTAGLEIDVGEDVQTSSGTAWAVGPETWATARHVVEGCTSVWIMTTPTAGVRASAIAVAPNADLAIITAPITREPLARAVEAGTIKSGSTAYHSGFPQGAPGDARSLYLGSTWASSVGRFQTRERVYVWAETGRSKGLNGQLGGMSGGPVLDDAGRVIGVTTAENHRRGRIFTAAPENIASLLAEAGATGAGGAPAEGLDKLTFAQVGEALRGATRIAKVNCHVTPPTTSGDDADPAG